MILFLSKQIMVLLLPLALLLVRGADWRKIKSWIRPALILALPVLVLLGWTLLLPDINAGITQQQNQQSTSGQISAVIEDPLVFAKAFIATFLVSSPQGDSVVTSLMGSFGWVDTPLAGVFIVIGYGLLFAYWFINYERKQLGVGISRLHRVSFLLIAALYAVGVCGAMYVLYTPVGATVIVGVQGRYLFPCLFLLLFVFFSRAVSMRKEHFVLLTKILTIFLLLVSAAAIFVRYYVSI